MNRHCDELNNNFVNSKYWIGWHTFLALVLVTLSLIMSVCKQMCFKLLFAYRPSPYQVSSFMMSIGKRKSARRLTSRLRHGLKPRYYLWFLTVSLVSLCIYAFALLMLATYSSKLISICRIISLLSNNTLCASSMEYYLSYVLHCCNLMMTSDT